MSIVTLDKLVVFGHELTDLFVFVVVYFFSNNSSQDVRDFT